MKVTKKAEDRIVSALQKFQPIIKRAHALDLNESDTVTIISDVLSEVMGYDKYVEVTSELAIRGMFCDLAVKIGGRFEYLIECKAIGTELKDNHLRQAVGYGSNKGISWVILTNSIDWQVYRIRFEQPISWDLVARFNLLEESSKSPQLIEKLFMISKDGTEKKVRDEVYEKTQCVNRFIIGAVIASQPVVQLVRKELRKIADGVNVSEEEVLKIITEECLRRDLTEGEEALAAGKKLCRLQAKFVVKPTKPEKEVVPTVSEQKVEPVVPVQTETASS